jgi:ankyrin repeat protein
MTYLTHAPRMSAARRRLGAVVHAMMSGNLAAANILLDAGADPNTVDGMGMTPLHHAVMSGGDEAATMLVRYGADATRKDGDGKTALDYAEGGAKAALEAALAARAEERAALGAQMDKLKDAACSGNVDELKKLLR